MATNEGTNQGWKKFLLPGAASLVGAGAGLALTKANKDKLRAALPSLDSGGIGDLVEDLREKVSSAVPTNPGSSSSSNSGSSSSRAKLDPSELEENRQRRAERRKQRAGR